MKKEQELEFERVVKQYKSVIYTVCFMFAKDDDEVNDLFQDTLINLWRGLKAFRGESEMKTWIWRVSLNTCVSHERKRKTASTPFIAEVNLFKEKSEDTRQIKMLYDRINRLKYVDRAIILLWLESFSYEEIAAIVGISVKNVSVRLFRIKEELKNMSNEKL